MTRREKALWICECFIVSVAFFIAELLKPFLIVIGWLMVAIGAFGAIPGNPLPTTPFLILAGLCFKISSPRLYEWLRNVKYLGPVLRDWEDHKRISKKAKTIAMVSITLSFSWSIYDASQVYVKVLLFCLALGVSTFILTRKSE